MALLIRFDGAALLSIQAHLRMDALDPIWIGIGSLANGGAVWLALSGALMIPKRTREVGILSLASMGLCALCTNVVLKNWVARPRPFDAVEGLSALIAHPTDWSFPSGHTTASFACALVLLRTMPRRCGVPAMVLASLIGASRLYVGVHYPTDVLGGVLVGLLGSSLVLALRERRRKKDAPSSAA